MKKKLVRRFTRKCAALCRWLRMYRRRVRMAELELGGRLEAC